MADNKPVLDGTETSFTMAMEDLTSVFYKRVVGATADGTSALGSPVLSGGVYYSAGRPTALTNGQSGWLSLNAQGHLIVDTSQSQEVTNSVLSAASDGNDKLGVVLYDDSGSVIPAISVIEDTAEAGADPMMPVAAVRRDSKASSSGTSGDWSTLNTNDVGDLRVDAGQFYAFENAPTVTSGAYTADDCVGGEIEITNAARSTGAGGVITNIVMAVEDDNADGVAASDYDIILFKSNPAGTYTDNTALAVTDADAFEIEAIITLDEHFDCGNVSLLQAKNLNVAYNCDATSLWAVAVDRTGNTLEATDAVQLRFKMIRD